MVSEPQGMPNHRARLRDTRVRELGTVLGRDKTLGNTTPPVHALRGLWQNFIYYFADYVLITEFDH